jgi:hypothetical protein
MTLQSYHKVVHISRNNLSENLSVNISCRVSGFATAGSKFLPIVRRARMVSS